MIGPGSVIVLHDGKGHGAKVAQILDNILPRLKALNFDIIKIENMKSNHFRLTSTSPPAHRRHAVVQNGDAIIQNRNHPGTTRRKSCMHSKEAPLPGPADSPGNRHRFIVIGGIC